MERELEPRLYYALLLAADGRLAEGRWQNVYGLTRSGELVGEGGWSADGRAEAIAAGLVAGLTYAGDRRDYARVFSVRLDDEVYSVHEHGSAQSAPVRCRPSAMRPAPRRRASALAAELNPSIERLTQTVPALMMSL